MITFSNIKNVYDITFREVEYLKLYRIINYMIDNKLSEISLLQFLELYNKF
jgi:hypothetical protein